MKTKFLFSIIFLLFIFLCKAAQIDSTRAKQFAENFYTEKVSLYFKKDIRNIQLEMVFTGTSENMPVYYMFDIKDMPGFIIISADDAVFPVLSYSFDGSCDPDNLSPAFKEWMKSYSEQILYVKKNMITASEKTSYIWLRYSKPPEFSLDKKTKDAGPLLTTKWNQDCGYNNYCPEDPAGPCSHVYTGCVATAMAQVMKYHNHPDTGSGSLCYIHSTYGELCADFGDTHYNWTAMPNGSSNEVAKLMYHCGVSVNMGYSPTGSGANTSTTASSLVKYFKYSPNILYTSKGNYTEENWKKLLRSELDSGRVLSYKGGNHAFVCDGYQGADFFHFNWGWGGSQDGYFYVDDLTPGSYNFTSSQACIVGVEPDTVFHGMNCAGAIILTCNVPYNGSTTDGANRINSYGCFSGHHTGKEKMHTITTTQPGRIKAKLSNLGGANLDVIILYDCCRDSCLTGGDSIAITDGDVPAGTYYIVVDGNYGYEGGYTLTVTCPNNKADLIVQQPHVSPYYVEHGMKNVFLSCFIKNSGKTPATASETKFYYSSNEFFDNHDLTVDSISVPSIKEGDSVKIVARVTMPDTGMTSGFGSRIIFEADADNDIDEFDEDFNYAKEYISVFDSGTIECPGAVVLSSGVTYHGNTDTEGNAVISGYNCQSLSPGKEVLHTITSPFDGKMYVYFNSPIGGGSPGQGGSQGSGSLFCAILNSCNEKSCIRSISPDSVLLNEIEVIKGHTYFLIVDAPSDTIEGKYELLVTLPDSCPGNLSMWVSGDTAICEGQYVYMNTDWNYNSYQWYKNGVPIPGANEGQYIANENGVYRVGVMENGCETLSREVHVASGPPPAEGAIISASGDTLFCEGSSVQLILASGTSYEYLWLLDGDTIPGETAMTCNALHSGTYKATVKFNSCTIHSNEIKIKVLPLPADSGETLAPSIFGLATYYPFTNTEYDKCDASGNGNNVGSSGATRCNDRFGVPERAYAFDGSNDYLYTTNMYDNPNKLTLVIWFKTATGSGGKMAGFSVSRFFSDSFKEDRHIYMDNAGKVYFGINNGSKAVVCSPNSYNDNKWHLAVATLSSAGMKLYIDTMLVDSRTTPITGENYKGYIKIGKGYLDGWTNKPTSNFFMGQLDDFRYYNREVSAEEVLVLYDILKKLTLSPTPLSVCDSGIAKVTIFNSQPHVSYRLRYEQNNNPASLPVEGNGKTIMLTADKVFSTTTFNIFSINNLTSCEHEMKSQVTQSVHATPATPDILQLYPDSLTCSIKTSGYLWLLNGTPLSEIKQTIFVNQPGQYKVIAYNNGCVSDTSNGYMYIPTDIVEKESGFMLYPNPCSTGEFVIYKDKQNGYVMDVIIRDLSGKQMYQQHCTNKERIHCTPNLQTGLYIIQIITENGSQYSKLLSITEKRF